MKPLFTLFISPLQIIKGSAKLFLVFLLIASLAFNVATLTISGVYAAASSMLSAAGFTTVATREAVEQTRREAAQKAQRKAAERTRRATQKIGQDTAQNVIRRAQRGAARNISSVVGEAIPFIGVGVIAGALALEVKDACDTARDMEGLKVALASDSDPVGARDTAIAAFDCGAMIREELPGYEDLPDRSEVWGAMRAAPAAAYEKARAAGISLDDVDWSGLKDWRPAWILNALEQTARFFSDQPETGAPVE